MLSPRLAALLLVLSAAVSGCSDEASSPNGADASDSTGDDAGAEVASDAPADMVIDGAADPTVDPPADALSDVDDELSSEDQSAADGPALELETALTAAPESTTWDAHAAFSFEGTGAASFECRLDEDVFASCASPHVVYDLGLGMHYFEVRALDGAGASDPTPAAHAWTVISVITEAHPNLVDDGFVPDPDPDGGTFRIKCEYSHANYDDPIVFPNGENRSHMHMFLGNMLADYSSTLESLISTGDSTCNGGTLNRSAYWAPALLAPAYDEADQRLMDSDGRPAYQVVLPLGEEFSTDIYYKSAIEGDLSVIQPHPAGLRMIAGDAMTTTPQSRDVVRWSCDSWVITSGDDFLLNIPDCAIGDLVRLTVTFPPCWNGTDLDSTDHKSHMSYPTWSDALGIHCPESHPVALTQVSYNFAWPVTEANTGPTDDTSDWRLSSDMYVESAEQPGGMSAHGDWFFAWHPEIMRTWVENCIHGGLHCAGGEIGNGLRLVGLTPGPGTVPEIYDRGLSGPTTD